MSYQVKEIFYTLQGEGLHSGRPAVFCRFTGCNLWTGREEDRPDAVCRFCDTDFRGTDGENGGEYRTACELSDRIAATWPKDSVATTARFVVCTGGEPLLQLDGDLIGALHDRGFQVAVETNGTRLAPAGLDWICVSPKANSELVLCSGNEIKLIYPQAEAPPERFAHLAFGYFFLQPQDGPRLAENTLACVSYCKARPQWRLSLQTHKVLGIP